MSPSKRKAAARGRTRQARGRDRVRVGVTLGVVAAISLALWATLRDTPPSAEEPVERFMHVHGLEIAPWAPGRVYLSTHEGLIRIDGDGQWHHVSEVAHDFMGFSVHPQEEGVMYSSGHPAPGSSLANPIGFMVSTDGGATWTPRALEGQADFHAMAVQAGDGDVVYGYNVAANPGLYRTLDGGATWEQIPAGPLDQVGALSLAVHPDDPDNVLAATETGLLASRDGGRSWEPLLQSVVTAVAYSADGERIVAYEIGRGLIASTDDGSSWEQLGFAAPGDDAVGHIAPHPDDPETIYLGTFGENLLGTSDGGSSWDQLAREGIPAGSR